jgi:hypothetical protein
VNPGHDHVTTALVVVEAVGEGILDEVRASVSYSLAAGAEVELL